MTALFKTSPLAGEVEAPASGEGYFKTLQQALNPRFQHLNKHPDSSSFALSVSSFAEDPGWCIRFNDKAIIFLDSPDSSLRSRRRMTLRVEALKTQFKTSPRAGEVDTLVFGEGYLINNPHKKIPALPKQSRDFYNLEDY